MKFWSTLEQDEDGAWIAECLSVPGCISLGTTQDEALANLREALALCLEVRDERGMPPIIEIDVSEFSSQDLALIEERLAGHHADPSSSLPVDDVIARLEQQFPKRS